MTLVGEEVTAGQKAPDFKAVDNSLQPVTLASTGNNVRIFSVVPSLDTPVCDIQTKRFNEESGKLPDVSIYTFSMDLPFAQKRYCGAANIQNLTTLSDVHNHSFGEHYGVLIEGLPLPLLSRAVFVLDSKGIITYVEYVPEVASHPNYDAALAALATAK